MLNLGGGFGFTRAEYVYVFGSSLCILNILTWFVVRIRHKSEIVGEVR